jgi:hypothetical protein
LFSLRPSSRIHAPAVTDDQYNRFLRHVEPVRKAR